MYYIEVIAVNCNLCTLARKKIKHYKKMAKKNEVEGMTLMLQLISLTYSYSYSSNVGHNSSSRFLLELWQSNRRKRNKTYTFQNVVEIFHQFCIHINSKLVVNKSTHRENNSCTISIRVCSADRRRSSVVNHKKEAYVITATVLKSIVL